MTPLTSSLNSAASQAGSSDAVSSIQPRSPPFAFVESVDTDFATSSNGFPALIEARASSAAFFASALAAAVGSVWPVATVGSTAITQMCRSSLRVFSSRIR